MFKVKSAASVMVSKCSNARCGDVHIYLVDDDKTIFATAVFRKDGMPAFVADLLRTAGITTDEFVQAARKMSN